MSHAAQPRAGVHASIQLESNASDNPPSSQTHQASLSLLKLPAPAKCSHLKGKTSTARCRHTPHPRGPGQSSSFHSSFLKRTTDITRSHERPEYVAKYPSGSHHDGHGTPKNTTHMTQGPSFRVRLDTWRGKSTFATQSYLGKPHSHHNHLQSGDYIINHISIQEIISSQAQCGLPSDHITVHNHQRDSIPLITIINPSSQEKPNLIPQMITSHFGTSGTRIHIRVLTFTFNHLNVTFLITFRVNIIGFSFEHPDANTVQYLEIERPVDSHIQFVPPRYFTFGVQFT
ncbi:hypothetical protein Nepgr_016423 [Nepenthes gracilis]|uniref:Uncharacterized protein n=1 Tax=Nepenthes gracilis TaxID=150966 RepID=A0AAD3SQD7_NEPGR|nr:hypothetical protein Nepgr_016423 [Nepenthes gracilis]